jgi:hypothetical protein
LLLVDGDPYIPFGFADAAYRYGHSQKRAPPSSGRPASATTRPTAACGQAQARDSWLGCPRDDETGARTGEGHRSRSSPQARPRAVPTVPRSDFLPSRARSPAPRHSHPVGEGL